MSDLAIRTLNAIVGTNLKRLRRERHLTLEELAARMGTGIDTGSLSRLENGKQGYSTKTLEAAAAALDVPVAVLMQTSARYEYELDDSAKTISARRIPVVGTAQLGDDGFWLEVGYPVGHGDGFVSFATTDSNAYAVRVKGDSMRPRIKPGEFVIVEPNAAVHPGDEVLVKVRDGRRMVKILNSRRHGLVELFSANDGHRPITLEEADIEAIHYVAGIAKPHLFRED